MKVKGLKLGLCLFASGLWAGCGSPGPPMPPSLELARPVRDLRATRKGDRVYLSWSTPFETTDKQRIRHPGVTEVCRSLTAAANDCATEVARLPELRTPGRRPPDQRSQASYADRLTQDFQRTNPLSLVWYGVQIQNSYGRTAGLSNRVSVPASPTVPPPDDFQAQLGRDGVKLTWSAVSLPAVPELRFIYRVYRREAGAKTDQIAGELEAAGQSSPEILDRNFEWEKTYDYRLTVVTLVPGGTGPQQSVEGEDSRTRRVVAHDVFPPEPPAGLAAAFSGPDEKPFIDLVWTANQEPDLAGYNIYRREPGGELRKLNPEPVTAPAFRDSQVAIGGRYLYSVSAVDVRGNESARSEEAAEGAPAQ
ncbi:MAG: hypothetical protein JOZ14_09435 [Acidobacteria bacterium]|nr:hypothetical protein [Acidobacteriota bacterium]